jgi:3-isopropylmalate/(R)-2-methylmalate dehydratase large subunit
VGDNKARGGNLVSSLNYTNEDKLTSQSYIDWVWNKHCLAIEQGETLLYVDLHMIHDLSALAFSGLEKSGRNVRRPDKTVAFADHTIPTNIPQSDTTKYQNVSSRKLVDRLKERTKNAHIQFFEPGSPGHGIAHVAAPELGIIRPGETVVCGDSHTCTLGALGTIAFGIGITDVEHVLATQTVWVRRPTVLRVNMIGKLQKGVSAKDVALTLVSRLAGGAGSGKALEIGGSYIANAPMDDRFTICNLAAETGASIAVIPPDDVTLKYIRSDTPVWTPQPLSEDIKVLNIDVSEIHPLITWGTRPEQIISLTDKYREIPSNATKETLDYMGLNQKNTLLGEPIDLVFIGSCANGRLSDLRAAAQILKGRKISDRLKKAIVSPGSLSVKQAAEAEGLDHVFRLAGFEWREPGCSFCVAMNGDIAESGDRVVSTSNRNFVGRQGPGVRTHLVSPASAAACALAGQITSVELYERTL